MTLSSIELWQRMAAEGLASPMQCRSWAGDVAKLLSAAESADGLKVLQKLIDIGKVTKYQAKILAGQSDEPLKRGPWHVLSKVKHPLWHGWLEITKIDTSKGEQPAPRWARWLNKDELNRLHPSAPSLPRGIQLANIQTAHLQTVEMPELIDGELQLRVHPVAGVNLSELFHVELPPADHAFQIIQQVAAALAAMHDKQVVHGRVTPDRIFWDDTIGVTLVRDPISVWTAGVEAGMTGVLGEQLLGMQVASFLAPEFLAPRQPPSMRSDIYALGATWWRLLTGQPPAEGRTVSATLGLAAEVALDFKNKLPHIPEPIRICLESCLAKNPSARIADARQLSAALTAAQHSVAKGKVMKAKPIAAPVAKSDPARNENKVATAPLAVEATNSLSQTAPSTLPKPTDLVNSPTVQPILAAVVETVEPIPTGEKLGTSAATQSATASPINLTKATSRKPATETKVLSNQPTSNEKGTTAVTPPQAAKPRQTPAPLQPVEPTQPTPKAKLEAEPASVAPTAAKPLAVQDTFTVVEPATQGSDTNESIKAKVSKPTQSETPILRATIAQEVVDEPAITAPTTNTKTQSPAARSTPVSRRRTKRKSKMPLFIIAGFGFLALVLGILKFSGALDAKVGKNTAKVEPYKPPATTTEPTVVKDPLLERFRIVESKEAVWAPPSIPEPISLDLLPPGAQLYIALRPNDLLNNNRTNQLLGTLNTQFQLDQLLNQISLRSGQQLESIASVVVAFYNAPSPEQVPVSALRVELRQAQSLDNLKSDWKASSEVVVGQEKLWVTVNDQAFYVPRSAPSEKVMVFSTGPVPAMSEAAELEGESAPLNAQFKLLQSKSSQQSELIMLGSPRYLFTEGRGLTKQLPNRLQGLLEPILSKDARAALLQFQFADRSYWELQLVAASDAETPRLISKLDERATVAAADVERWFVDQTPHPYWRALAFRFPQMIRTWREYTRFGVEDGVGIANGYLPADASSNLIVASWIAMQEASTMVGQLADASSPSSNQAMQTMSPDDILDRPIRLAFEQEPIERALALVGEEANSGVPAASQMRFELDGEAFKLAGITRNQQLRDFKIETQPARNALTEIAKRGNPVTTVTDTRETDQRLIWVIKDDPQNAGKKMVSLTTRDAATAAGNALPVEFAPN